MAARNGSTTTLGEVIRAQRHMANLSLRQLSVLAKVSNPYLSQVERGVHQPSVRVLRGIAEALNVSAEALLVQAGLLSSVSVPDDGATVAAISNDPRLTAEQRRALLGVYRSYVGDHPDGDRLHQHTQPVQDGNAPVASGPRQTRRTSA